MKVKRNLSWWCYSCGVCLDSRHNFSVFLLPRKFHFYMILFLHSSTLLHLHHISLCHWPIVIQGCAVNGVEAILDFIHSLPVRLLQSLSILQELIIHIKYFGSDILDWSSALFFCCDKLSDEYPAWIQSRKYSHFILITKSHLFKCYI